jgi:two-component system response regulator
MGHGRAVSILLVEDNPDHAELTMRALRDGNMLNEIAWVKDGAEALDFLHQRGPWAEGRAFRPGLILLDIRLPKLDGRDVLQHIKNDAGLRSIPVVMLTTSEQQDEVAACYQAGVNSFVSKPVRFTEFAQKVKSVKLYWLLTSLLPEP